jgi:hypothetical protein
MSSLQNDYSGTSVSSIADSGSGVLNSAQNGLAEFMNSNSLVAKISFLLLVIFVFVLLLQFCISIMGYFLGPTSSPHLINGMVDAKQMLTLSTNSVAYLSTAQVDALNSGQLNALSTRQIQSLLTTQLVSIQSSAIAALSTAALQALGASGIASLS